MSHQVDRVQGHPADEAQTQQGKHLQVKVANTGVQFTPNEEVIQPGICKRNIHVRGWLPVDGEVLCEGGLPVEGGVLCEGWLPVDGEVLCERWLPVDGEVLCEGWLPVDGEVVCKGEGTN